MKILLAGNEADGRLFALCFEPDCVFEVVPAHGGKWSAKFLFGTEPTGEEKALIEDRLVMLCREEI